MRKSPVFAGVGALLLIAVSAPVASGAGSGQHPHQHRHRHIHSHGSAPLAVCEDSELLFCEDFDSLPAGEASSQNWETVSQNGTLTVEDAARSDGKELHIRTQDNGSAFLEVNDFAPPGNSFWGRIRLRVDAFPTAPDWAHWTMVEAAGHGDGVIRPLGGQYVPDTGTDLWGVGSDGGPTGDWTAWQESAPAEAGVWQCVEWRMDASDNRIAVWIDGEQKPELGVDTTHHGGDDVDFVFPEFDTVKFGWQLYQSGSVPSAFDVRLDDIALSSDRVSCDV